MTKPASSQSSLNPWEALLASATRARPPQDSSTSTSSSPMTTSDAILGGGYTILLQHSMTPKSQRKWAIESTIANVDSNSNSNVTTNASLSSQFASSLSIQQHHANNQTSSSSASARRAGGDWYGTSGPFLVRQAFHDLSKKCNGRVVLVSVAGTSGIWDLDQEYNDDAAYDHQSRTDDDKNNVDVIKLFRQNGACVDLNSNPFGWNEDNNNHNSCNDDDSFSTKATLNNLQSIAVAIRQAASRIEENNSEQQSKQPIPIIFDSLTPLLHLHGAERITILLKSLGRTSPPLGNSSSSSTNSSLCLSPIIAPILYESICLSDHRTLEDCADAMVQLNLMDSTSTPTNYAIEAKDDNSVVVVSGVMDLIRRGGGGSNGLGGKLMRHCVPVHILRSLSTTRDLRDGCYWIIDNGDDDNTARDGDATEKKGKKQTSSSSATDEMGQSQSTDNSSRPKIYLEDDDPDFQDYDEDDDLDL